MSSICAGHTHTCLVKAGKVFCWGDNQQMQTGQDSVPGDSLGVPVPMEVAGIPENVTTLSCGYEYTCVVLVDNRAMCWGGNAHAQLGTGVSSLTGFSTPQPVFDYNDVVDIVPGFFSTCVVRLIFSEKQTWCWGNNRSGQLGRGFSGGTYPQASRITPDYPGGIKAFAPGGNLAFCGIAEQDSAAFCVGTGMAVLDTNGVLVVRYSLASVLGLTSNVRQIGMSVWARRACAVLNNGTAYCWGRYIDYCCIGDGSATENSFEPLRVDPTGNADFVQIAVGQNTICAVRGATAGEVWCWGTDDVGGLGDGIGQSPNALLPQRVELIPIT